MDIVIALMVIGAICLFYQLFSSKKFDDKKLNAALKKWHITPDLVLDRPEEFFTIDKSKRQLLQVSKIKPDVSRVYDLKHLKNCPLLLTYLEDQILTEIDLELEFDDGIRCRIPFFHSKTDNGVERARSLKQAKNWKSFLNKKYGETRTIRIT